MLPHPALADSSDGTHLQLKYTNLVEVIGGEGRDKTSQGGVGAGDTKLERELGN